MKSIFWTQDWGTYPDHTLVCCGFFKYEEVVKLTAKQKCLDWSKALEHRSKLDPPTSNPHFTRWEFKGDSYSVLWLIDWKPNVEHYAILAHELTHGIHLVLGRRLDACEEIEASAYQMQFLFERIVKKLNDFYRKK